MLQIKNIYKQYKTGSLVQTALNDVSINLRDNEFVAILGPSGSGKTTLLNVIGGLDRYDGGDLIINGISTKEYKSRDWDAYRNHTIGFVFQSYNLIPHQSVLANVELSLTISGISRSERRKRAKEALEQVGLGDQLHKRPNQMSGGQMQRVAIARALVNNPDILLADEPTGALDTETGIQVMELLKSVAKDRLVVMVTHNPELAEQYANRIIKLRDGKILDDTNPFNPEESEIDKPQNKKMGKASMSFLTALSLSFNNLRTKKGRTILTSFAGSIGIIGISLILALSNGVNTYITDIQKSTMSSYPITIDSETIDISSIIDAHNDVLDNEKSNRKLDKVYSDNTTLKMKSEITTSVTHNNLTAFKKYIDDPKNKIHDYIGENGVVYSYSTRFGVYTHDSENTLVNTDGSTLKDDNSLLSNMSLPTDTSQSGMAVSVFSANNKNKNFQQLLPGNNGKNLSTAVTENYELVYGNWPSEYNDVVLVLDKDNEISTETLYELGVLPTSEYKKIEQDIKEDKKVSFEDRSWSYKDICSQDLRMIPMCDTYEKNSKGYYDSFADDNEKIEELMKTAVKLNIVGVIRPKENASYSEIRSAIGYTKALTDYIIEKTNNSEIVKAQEADKDINILTGMKFSPSDDKAKIEDVKKYINNMGISDKAALGKTILSTSANNGTNTNTATNANTNVNAADNTNANTNVNAAGNTNANTNVNAAGNTNANTNVNAAGNTNANTNVNAAGNTNANTNVNAAGNTNANTNVNAAGNTNANANTNAVGNTNANANANIPSGQSGEMSEEQLAAAFDNYIKTADDDFLISMYDNYISSGTYDDNMSDFGVVSLDAPSSINIYTDSFEDKDSIAECISDYNKKASDADKISYTDYVGLIMSSVTTIINVISYVLIAFVAVSLIVSSIMIGIITYISVLERTKEIGILRAIGASKRNISQVFNAETFIIGLLSGVIGIGVTLILLIPGNMIIHAVAGTDTVNAVLPFVGAIILIVLSIVLTLLGGLIPSKKAAKKDPVTALRTE